MCCFLINFFFCGFGVHPFEIGTKDIGGTTALPYIGGTTALPHTHIYIYRGYYCTAIYIGGSTALHLYRGYYIYIYIYRRVLLHSHIYIGSTTALPYI